MAAQTSQPSISEVRFGSFLVYSPHGQSQVSKTSKDWCLRIKQDSGGAIALTVKRLREELDATPLGEFLAPGVTIVPAPRSAPLVEGALWPARRIADELVSVGLATEVLPVVRRAVPVPKSATAARGDRPPLTQHIDSFALEPLLANPQRITIVDDVITMGRTLLAVATVLAARFPGADIRAFALVRTMGLQPDVETILMPCVGVIRRNVWNDATRQDDVTPFPAA